MLSVDFLLAVCLVYVALLFAVAFFVDRQARRGWSGWMYSPVIYTLSISVYCTSWTFYGAVGSAARNGLEFVTIYLGPTLVFVGWWWILRKLVRICRTQRITSIADLISSRYGKSESLAVLVTVIALIATTPYIALQLQSVTRSYQVIATDAGDVDTAFWVAAGMALFTILFGTRNLDANERHHGVVAAIAIEAVVKLVALIGVGAFAVFSVAGGVDEVFRDIPADILEGTQDVFGPRWAVITFLSAAAIICLPRQFQVTVVENIDERHLATASWLFPLYLLGMCLFIVPIAIVGLNVLPEGSNPDLFVLTIPLMENRHDIALLAFLGGFSSATSMVIVAAIAVSTMVSNHIVMPVALNFLSADRVVSGDVRNLLLLSRRISIGVVLGLGFLYFRVSGGSDALAAIGLIAFVGAAQFLPSLLGGIFWRGATRSGALAGLVVGFALWIYTLLLPSFGGEFLLSQATLENGPWGIEMLRPEALFGLREVDPLVHAVVWSVGANALVFMAVSALTGVTPLEQLQGAQFVEIFRSTRAGAARSETGTANPDDLFILAQRIMGADPARRLFDQMARAQGQASGLPYPTDAMIDNLERELAGSIGSASAHAMVSRLVGRERVGLTELIDIADETQQLIETSRQLTEKSDQLERAASQLREANDRLKRLDAQKDDFLSQVSHELRTPMTSIRSFSEILLGDHQVDQEERTRFMNIIHQEILRLTRLLDEILDIGQLEAGTLHLPTSSVDANNAIQAALDTVVGMTRDKGVSVDVPASGGSALVTANEDRLKQVLINLLSNAVKYNANADPRIRIEAHASSGFLNIDVIDNGGGVSHEEAKTVFEKFRRGDRAGLSHGAGLGLPISRAIMRTMGGDLMVRFTDPTSSFFRVRLPLSQAAE